MVVDMTLRPRRTRARPRPGKRTSDAPRRRKRSGPRISYPALQGLLADGPVRCGIVGRKDADLHPHIVRAAALGRRRLQVHRSQRGLGAGRSSGNSATAALPQGERVPLWQRLGAVWVSEPIVRKPLPLNLSCLRRGARDSPKMMTSNTGVGPCATVDHGPPSAGWIAPVIQSTYEPTSARF
jgi:hypothetical protein